MRAAAEGQDERQIATALQLAEMCKATLDGIPEGLRNDDWTQRCTDLDAVTKLLRKRARALK